MTHFRLFTNMMLAGAALFATTTISAQQPLFDELTDAYFTAFDQNEAADYLQAYGAMLSVSRQADSLLQARGKSTADVADGEFRGFYWNVKKSVAEIAYMLGQHTVLQQVSRQLTASLQGRTTSDADKDGFLADIAKIDGDRHFLTEQFDSAETALRQAIALKPHDMPFVQAVRGDLAQLYYRQQQDAETMEQLDAILAMVNRDASNEAKRMEVSSQRAICLARMGKYDEALSIINNVVDSYRQHNDQRRLAEALRKKGKILMLQYDATGNFNAAATACYEEYLRLARTFVDENFCAMNESAREQYWMAERSFVTDCFRLEDKAPTLLYDVALFSKSVLLQLGLTFTPDMNEQQRRDALAAVRVTWQQVQQGLTRNDVAVEFVNYEKLGQPHLGALVLTKRGEPRFVPIAAVSAITEHKVKWGFKKIPVSELFTIRGGEEAISTLRRIDAIYNDSTLTTLLWPEALCSAIGQANKVFFAVDGILHRLAPEYLLPIALRDKQLMRLTSTRQLTSARSAINTSQMLLCGGVDFTQARETAYGVNDELAYNILSNSFASSHLADLPNSRIEVDNISSMRQAHQSDLVLHADTVSEPHIRQLLAQYPAFLISTHGSFEQAATLGTDIRPASADLQLSQSCIYLAGADASLHTEGFDASQCDGILSAREVAALNLENLDLVVLSACQTGLGFITPDGVFGMQRGLKAAGVRAIVTSLWEVRDDASSQFMFFLFTNLEAGMPLQQSFDTARRQLKDIAKYNNPYFYDAFILIDALEDS